MRDHGTGIQWTQRAGTKGETWNPVVGCRKVSPGCRGCYAMKDAQRTILRTRGAMAARDDGGTPNQRRLLDIYEPTVRTNPDGSPRPEWSGRAVAADWRLDQPLRWRSPRTVFVNSMSDLFHEDVPFSFIRAVFGVMAAARQHTFLVLTKRPARAAEVFEDMARTGCVARRPFGSEYPSEVLMLDAEAQGVDFPTSTVAHGDWPFANVWLGVSVENKDTLHRVEALAGIPAAIRFVSYEPALEQVDFLPHLERGEVDWLIVGGESGKQARPFDVEWAAATVEACAWAGVPCFVKQLGSNPVACFYSDERDAWEEEMPGGWPWPIGWRPGDGQPRLDAMVRLPLRHSKGGDPTEWPEHLRVREFPR